LAFICGGHLEVYNFFRKSEADGSDQNREIFTTFVTVAISNQVNFIFRQKTSSMKTAIISDIRLCRRRGSHCSRTYVPSSPKITFNIKILINVTKSNRKAD